MVRSQSGKTNFNMCDLDTVLVNKMNMSDLFYFRKHTNSHDIKFIFLGSLHVLETKVFSKTNHYLGNMGNYQWTSAKPPCGKHSCFSRDSVF